MYIIILLLIIPPIVTFICKCIKKHRCDYGADYSINLHNENAYFYDSYQRKYLFTKHELAAYYPLTDIVKKNDCVLFVKVRLWDLIEPKYNVSNRRACIGKIRAKHVDFVICDKQMHAKWVIELDDSSHDTIERKKRDVFVDNILENCGYKVLHTRNINEKEIDAFLKG